MFSREEIILNLSLNHIAFYLFTLAITEAVCIYLWRYRDIPGVMPFFGCQVMRSFWILGHFFIRLSSKLPIALFWREFSGVTSVFLAYFWCIFAMEVSRQEQKTPAMLKVIIHSLAGIAMLAIAGDFWYAQFIAGAFIDEGKLTILLGPGYRLTAFCAYVLVALGSMILIGWTRTAHGWRRQMALLLSFAPVFTIAGHFLYFFPALSGYFPFMIGSLLSELYSVWVFYRWRIFSILPFAQEAVVKNMIDGLLVVDEKGYIVEINPAAVNILQGLPAVIGSEFRHLRTSWPALADSGGNPEWHAGVGYRDYPYGRRHYQISVIPLYSRHKHVLGKTIIMKDVTKQKQDQEKIIDQQKALAVLTERNRLGREIHDGDGQIWNYLLLEMQTLKSLFVGGQQEAAEKQADQLSHIFRKLNEDVRESIVGLKSSDLLNCNLLESLREYLKWYEKTYGIIVRLILPEGSKVRFLSETGEMQLLRIIQEALTNVRKHAGANQVEIVMHKQDKELRLTIEDNGCGFDPVAVPAGKYGLAVMRERSEEAGGQFRIESVRGTGTKLTLSFAGVIDDGDKKTSGSVAGR